MGVTAERAGELLDQVDQVARTTRQRATYDGLGPILIVWGVICVAQFAPAAAWWTWLVGDTVGIGATVYLGWIRPRGGPILGKSLRREERKLMVFWAFVFIYGTGWLAVLWPWQTEQLALFCVTLVMFAYVVMGLWLDMPFLFWLGLAVTVIAGGGYVLLPLVLPGYLNLWLGLAVGGALAGSGVYLLRHERLCHA